MVVVAVLAAGGAWWLGLFSETEAEVSIEEAATGLDDSTGTPGEEPAALDDLTGTWSVVAGEQTFVGYRVEEVLANIGDITAVGRSGAVTGSLVAEGNTVTAVDIVADLTELKSDRSARDRQMETQALETDTFPEASFSLTEPIEIPTVPADASQVVELTAVGELTLHGVTRPIQLSLQGTVAGSSLVVVGSTEILMSDYDIEPPRAPIVASVDELAVMEVSLVFTRS